MPASIYAEALLNIRQVTVSVSLSSGRDHSTSLSLSPDGTLLQVHHQGHTAGIRLPFPVVVVPHPGAQLALPQELGAKTEFSFRLPLAAPDHGGAAAPKYAAPAAWSAEVLAGTASTTALACRGCGETWASAGCIRQWKDLPDENWAEMMELWHCHKPDIVPDNKGHEHDGEATAAANGYSKKGYASTNRLTAQASIGLVGVHSVLLSPDDCLGLETRRKQLSARSGGREAVICRRCQSEAGYVDAQACGWRLYSWTVAARRKSDDEPLTWSLEASLSAYLLALIGSQAITKFILHDDAGGDQPGLMIWVFNPDIYYSASLAPDSGPQRAMKVFYKRVPNSSSLLEANSRSIEEVILPSSTVAHLHQSLERTRQLIPSSARSLQDWHAAVLPRPTGKT